MYGAGVMGNRERVMAQISELRAEPGRLCARAQAGLAVLASHPLMDARIALVGYCFGGMTALELARNGAALAGAASIHGTLSTNRPAESGSLKAKILVCHGALDPHIPMSQVNSFSEEMNRADADWQLVIYGRALHGFTHKDATSMPGVAYNALADARSSAALHGFLGEVFG
jgi:dienelactone hydrolase